MPGIGNIDVVQCGMKNNRTYTVLITIDWKLVGIYLYRLQSGQIQYPQALLACPNIKFVRIQRVYCQRGTLPVFVTGVRCVWIIVCAARIIDIASTSAVCSKMKLNASCY